MRFAFAGTTEFGISTLEKLIAAGHELKFVITNPDRPTGRKQELTATIIKTWAQKHNIQAFDPVKISEIESELRSAGLDVLLVAAYGQIIPKNILNIPKHGSVNIHGSLLPKYRGPSPIQTAILNGEKETGITFILMDEKMDHGAILSMHKLPIYQQDTYETLYKKLALLASEECVKTLQDYVLGKLNPVLQNDSQASYTKMFGTADGQIVWTDSAQQIANQIRALNPNPGTWTTLEGKKVKILKVTVLPEVKIELAGKLYRTPDGLAVKSADQSMLLDLVQPEGKKPMTGVEFANGLKNLDRRYFV
jgi:methionyl-tRNA formyltransferase